MLERYVYLKKNYLINFGSAQCLFIQSIKQGIGIAQKVLTLIEEMFPEAQSFELATILEEERNCFLYEKMGYKRTEVIKKLNDKTTLIHYKKER